MKEVAAIPRLYLDTCIYGGYFDVEFELATRRLFAAVRAGQAVVLFSQLVVAELEFAPERVQALALSVSSPPAEKVWLSAAALALRGAYMDAGVVSPKSERDAEHVAIASVARADAIVSWNFQHIVHSDRISGYNGVNAANGYNALRIVSPPEVRFDE